MLIMDKLGNSTMIKERLIEQWFKQTLCVSYFIMIHSCYFIIWSVKNPTLYISYFNICQFRIYLVTEQWFILTNFVGYITKIHSCISMIRPWNKKTLRIIWFTVLLWVHLIIQLWFNNDSLNSNLIRKLCWIFY